MTKTSRVRIHQETFAGESWPESATSKPATDPSRPIAGRIGPDLVIADGEPLILAFEDDPHHPGIGQSRRRVFDLKRVAGPVEARVTTYPEGPRCICPAWQSRRRCGHVLGLIEAGHLPELSIPAATQTGGGA